MENDCEEEILGNQMPGMQVLPSKSPWQAHQIVRTSQYSQTLRWVDPANLDQLVDGLVPPTHLK